MRAHDYVHLQIANFLDEAVDIYLHYSTITKYFLITLLPQSCVWLPSVPFNTIFSAYSHVIREERYFDDQFVVVENPPESWNLSSKLYYGHTEPTLHNHDLIYKASLNEDGFCCDTCSITIKDRPVFICSEYVKDPGGGGCSYSSCTACFYEYMLQRTLNHIEEDLSLTVHGEHWFGSSFLKPKISHAQNSLVKSILEDYTKAAETESDKSDKSDKTESDKTESDKTAEREEFKKFFPGLFAKKSEDEGKDDDLGEEEVSGDEEFSEEEPPTVPNYTKENDVVLEGTIEESGDNDPPYHRLD